MLLLKCGAISELYMILRVYFGRNMWHLELLSYCKYWRSYDIFKALENEKLRKQPLHFVSFFWTTKTSRL